MEYSNSKLLFYSMEGDYLRSQEKQIESFAFSDSIMWIGGFGTIWERYHAYSVATNGDTITCIPNNRRLLYRCHRRA